MPTNKKRDIKAAAAPSKKTDQIIAMSAPVTIAAADAEKKGPREFEAEVYTGGALELADFDYPVVVDLAGLSKGNVLVANLDHDNTKRVGNFEIDNDGQRLVAKGKASAATAARDEVVNSASEGYVWQASIEARPTKPLKFVKAGQTVQVNGKTFTGPISVAGKTTLKGFAFVSHGADDNTSVTIAASAAHTKENDMDPKCKEWIEAMGFSVEDLSADQLSNLEADYNGRDGKRKQEPTPGVDPLDKRKVEAERRKEIKDISERWCDDAIEAENYEHIAVIRQKRDEAIKSGMSVRDFRYEAQIATLTEAPPTIHGTRDRNITTKVVEAAVCLQGGLNDIEKAYDEQTLELAQEHFKQGIGLNEIILMAAESNGYRGPSRSKVTIEAQRAAFGQPSQGRMIHAAGAFSTLSLPNAFANIANKFIREQWLYVDQAWRDVSVVRPVSDFRQISTVSLTGDVVFEQLGAGGEIKHGQVGEEVYTNQANTYAKMFGITRKDIINDDIGVLSQIPRRLGRGAALKLNDIFWREFMNPSIANFFHTSNANVSTVDGTLSLAGLDQANVIFMAQTDPDGQPLGSTPRILLVPTGLSTVARQLMNSELLLGTSGVAANIWRGRFRVVETPYLSNTAYTGSSAVAWYLLADPNDIPVIEVVALNGRVEPTVDTADADFNVLGVQMRGYSDVGVKMQEPRGGVRADGSAA